MNTCIIIPTHNRQDTTFRCLQNLAAQGVFDWATVVVVDDGSTDGTPERVARDWPAVTLLHGDGTLWWTGAICRGMEWAMEHGAARVFWLNDDCLPRPGTLVQLRNHSDTCQAIAVGQAVTPSGLKYGGYRKTRTWLDLIPCDTEDKDCETFNGNCVCIPRAVVERIGYPDASGLPHALADTDYGLRATRAGIPAHLVAGAICDNEQNPAVGSWLLGDTSLRDIWRYVATPKGGLYAPAFIRFCLRHWGLRGVAVMAVPYAKLFGIVLLRVVLPDRLRKAGLRRVLRRGAT